MSLINKTIENSKQMGKPKHNLHQPMLSSSVLALVLQKEIPKRRECARKEPRVCNFCGDGLLRSEE